MTKSATAVEVSKASKLGPCSATYAAQSSCPPSCPLYKNGCYGEGGMTGYTTRRLNKSDDDYIEVAKSEAAAIDKLSGLMDLRLHVVGDCKTDEAARIVSDAATRFKRRRRPTDVWTFNHAWRDVDRASWGEVSVLASCHSPAEVREAMDRGYATAMTIEKMPPKAYKEDGITFVPCVEQTKGRTCVECRLCFKDSMLLDKKITILLEVHTSPTKANAAISNYLGVAE